MKKRIRKKVIGIIGIYKITSPSGKINIGQSVNINKRWGDYKNLTNCSEQDRLYNSFLKYGVENHKFEIIQVMEEYDIDELNFYEAFWGGFYDVTGKNGLNIRECGGAYGRHNEATKKKIGDKHRGKPKSPSHIKNMKKPKSEGHKEKLRQANLGKKQSEETKEKKRKYAIENNIKPRCRYREDYSEEELKKLSEKWSGANNPNYRNNNMTPAHKEKLRLANLGRKPSQAQINHITELGKKPKSKKTRKKMSKSAKGKKKHPDAVKKSADSRRGKKASEGTKLKMSISRTGEGNPMYGRKGKDNPNYGKKRTPEQIKRIVEGRKGFKHTDAFKKSQSDRMKLRGVNMDAIRKTADKNRGKKRSLDAIKRTADKNRGKKRSKEVREKMSIQRTGLKQSAKTIAKRIATRKRNKKLKLRKGI
ncbi:MAG TPA: NUMOD3 domain-containing DNA-binding protein [Bacteroidia bacterium]|jgi:group I intron endonuclease|nr:NUMOD3 domain-containing DNA-binding protein [Bacteroidia bacterium]